MGARTGNDYIASIKKMKPTVYLNGRLVEDVTEEPAFKGTINSMAQLYDLQHEERYRDFALYESPTTGDLVSSSFMIPRTHEELVKKRQTFKLRTDHNFGFMGRTMDFMNPLVTGWYQNRHRFAERGEQFGKNAEKFYEFVRENDLFLTHVLVAPQIDRSKTSAEQEDPFLHLGRVRETPEGIIVRGAKMLGTMAPITEEIFVMPFGGIAPGDDAYAVTFSIPTDAPGLKLFCREPVSVYPNNRQDHPLSSRFEEMDCIAVFDDVLVPWDRVIVDGGPGSGQLINSLPPAATIGVSQTAARFLSQMEFLTGLAMKVADATGINGFLHVQEKLGEMLAKVELGRGIFYGSEALALEQPDGSLVAAPLATQAFHLQTMSIYRRFVEIIQLLAGGGFFQAPALADMQSEEERPFIDKYFRGRPGVSAEERIRLFKLAWDVTGTAFAQRVQQYVTYYSGDPIRLTASFYLRYDKQPLFDIVDRALGNIDDLDIVPSPGFGVTAATQPKLDGSTSGAYPTASLPKASVKA